MANGINACRVERRFEASPNSRVLDLTGSVDNEVNKDHSVNLNVCGKYRFLSKDGDWRDDSVWIRG